MMTPRPFSTITFFLLMSTVSSDGGSFTTPSNIQLGMPNEKGISVVRTQRIDLEPLSKTSRDIPIQMKRNHYQESSGKSTKREKRSRFTSDNTPKSYWSYQGIGESFSASGRSGSTDSFNSDTYSPQEWSARSPNEPVGSYLKNGYSIQSLYNDGAKNFHFQWMEEPPKDYVFSNSTGGRLNCVAGGDNVQPMITWSYADGTPIAENQNIVNSFTNGTLVFMPFGARRYDPLVHNARYMCLAHTLMGIYASKPTHVVAVLDSDYPLEVYDAHVIAGNSAVFRCRTPSYIQSHVSVLSWIRDDAYNIFPTRAGDGKYFMSKSGELRVLSVSKLDESSNFRCRVMDKITGRTRVSQPAFLDVTDSTGPVAPRAIQGQMNKVRVADGTSATLPCDAVAFPVATHTWYKGASRIPMSGSGSKYQAAGNALVIAPVTTTDGGEYRCIVNNTAGSIVITAHVIVTQPLAVQVSPHVFQITPGHTLELLCKVSGSPVHTVSWLRNGKVIRPVSPHPEVLRILSPQKSDGGVYQCRVEAEHGYGQDSAVVTMGASAPKLQYRFIAHTLQPGPAVTLKCIARGSPVPTIQWTLDGFPLPQSPRFLIGQFVLSHGDVISHVNITSVRVSDGGLYRCLAHNSGGEEGHEERLNIYGLPTVREMMSQTAVAGETFSVTCPVGGYPIEKIVWSKDGDELPLSDRQSVNLSGKLSISHVTRDSDQGEYSCQASDRQGRVDKGTFALSVTVPPTLAPVMISKGTKAGMRAQITCLVQEGDLPITIVWLKDGHPIDPNNIIPLKIKKSSPSFSFEDFSNDLHISQLNEFTSVLVIERAKAKHTGNYTCAASNSAKTSFSSATLTVMVPPTWLIEPSDESVNFGGTLELPCSAVGYPPPTVVWKKQQATGSWQAVSYNPLQNSDSSKISKFSLGQRVGNSLGDYKGRSSESHNNVTLVVIGADKQHEGKYMCQAKNGVGPGLSKLIKLNVDEPPYFYSDNFILDTSKDSTSIEAEVGSKAVLNCHVGGDKPLQLRWSREGSEINHFGQRYSVETKTPSPDGVVTSVLSIDSASREDSGSYSCFASNELGSKVKSFELQVQDVPENPTNIQILEKGSRYVLLSWSTNSKKTAPITSYIVYYSKPGESPSEIRSTKKILKIDSLKPFTLYTFRVKAENSIGRSEASPSVEVTTYEDKPAGYPRNLKETKTSSHSVELSWSPPLNNETNGVIFGYQLSFGAIKKPGYSSSKGFTAMVDTKKNLAEVILSSTDPYTSESLNPKVSIVRQSETALQIGLPQPIIVENLKADTEYEFSIRASNSKGLGPASPKLKITTLEGKPSAAPQFISCEAFSSSTIIVSWSPPPEEHRNGKIVSYRIGYKRIRDNKEGQKTSSLLESESHTNSLMNQKYRQSSILSTNIQPLISDTLNEEDSFFKSNYRGNSFGDAPSVSEQGVLVVRENLQARLVSLKAFSDYLVVVSASTAGGSGVMSDAVKCTTLEDVPPAPTSIKVVQRSPSSVIVSWKHPQESHGVLTHHTIRWRQLRRGERVGESREQEDGHVTVDGDKTHAILKNLPLGAVEVWASVSTSVGEGRSTPKVGVMLSETVPAGIWSSGGTVSPPWHSHIILPCNVVGDEDPVRVWKFNGKQLEKDKSLTLLPNGSIHISNILPTHSGNYSCTTKNSFGQDMVNHFVKVLVPPSAPHLHITESTSTSVRLQWSVDETGGSAIKQATLVYNRSGSPHSESLSGTRHSVDNLKCGTRYNFSLTVRNEIGWSDPSVSVFGRTKGHTPSSPPSFQFLTNNSTHATLYFSHWRDGGCNITHFSVLYKQKKDNDWIVVNQRLPPTRLYVLSDLKADKTYDLRVTAYNSAGSSSADYTLSTTDNTGFSPDLSGQRYSIVVGERATASVWSSPRVYVPLIIGILALMLMAATFVTYFITKKRRQEKSKNSADNEVIKLSSMNSVQGHKIYNGDPHFLSAAKVDIYEAEDRPSNRESDTYQYISATLPSGSNYDHNSHHIPTTSMANCSSDEVHPGIYGGYPHNADGLNETAAPPQYCVNPYPEYAPHHNKRSRRKDKSKSAMVENFQSEDQYRLDDGLDKCYPDEMYGELHGNYSSNLFEYSAKEIPIDYPKANSSGYLYQKIPKTKRKDKNSENDLDKARDYNKMSQNTLNRYKVTFDNS